MSMNVVTGAFGYIGRYIARRLLDAGETVRTITTHPDKPNPFGESVQAFPLNFENPDEITANLRGATTLFNTYWIRFAYGGVTFEQAVHNTAVLFDCARQAGVKRIVHISVTNASLDSNLAYYRGKARQEQVLVTCGLPYAIIRPTLVFGREDILVNNIAWLLRKFPVFPIFGTGAYRLQPVFVGDVAEVAVASAKEQGPKTVDAIGPETYSFSEFVNLLASQLNPGVRLVRLPPRAGIALGSLIGLAMRDVLLTQAELQGLMEEMLTSQQAPNGSTRFSQWLAEHRNEIGKSYTSELQRHFHWSKSS